MPSVLLNGKTTDEELTVLDLYAGPCHLQNRLFKSRWQRQNYGLAYYRPTARKELDRVYDLLQREDCRPLMYYHRRPSNRWGIANVEEWAKYMAYAVRDTDSKIQPDFYTLTTPDNPVKLYFDIDGTIKDSDKEHEETVAAVARITSLVKEAAGKLNLGIPDSHLSPVVESAIREKPNGSRKLSLHVVYPEIYFEDPDTLRNFCGYKQHLHQETLPDVDKEYLLWDVVPYGNWREFRTAGSLKVDRDGKGLQPNSALTMLDEWLNPIMKPTRKNFMDRCVVYCPTDVPHFMVKKNKCLPRLIKRKGRYLSSANGRIATEASEEADADLFWTSVLTGMAYEVVTIRLRMSGFRKAYPANGVSMQYDPEKITVTPMPKYPGTYKMVIQGDHYCEITKRIHDGPVWFVFNVRNLTYYQTDMSCQAHMQGGSEKILRTCNPFQAGATQHSIRSGEHEQPRPLCELLNDGTISRLHMGFIKLYANYIRHRVKSTRPYNNKYEAYYFDEQTALWSSSVLGLVRNTYTDFVCKFVHAIMEGERDSFEFSDKERQAVYSAYGGISLQNVTNIVCERCVDEIFVEQLDIASPHLIPLSDNTVFDAMTRQVAYREEKHMFKQHMDFNIIPEDDPIIAEVEAWLKEIFIGKDASDKQDEWTFWRHWIGYLFSGYHSDRHFYLLFGNGLNGKGLFEAVLTKALGKFFVKVPAAFLTARGAAFTGAENASPMMMQIRRARVAMASEFPGGAALDLTKMKTITSGDKQSGRNLHGEVTEFHVQAKIMIACNDPPDIGNEKAMEDRVFIHNMPTRYVNEPQKPNEMARDVKKADYIKDNLIDAFGSFACYALADLLDGTSAPPVLQPYPESIRTCIHQFVQDTNLTRKWFDEQVILDPPKPTSAELFIEFQLDPNNIPDWYVPMGQAHGAYTQWCKTRNYTEAQRTPYEAFVRAVKQLDQREVTERRAQAGRMIKHPGFVLEQARLLVDNLHPDDKNYITMRQNGPSCDMNA